MQAYSQHGYVLYRSKYGFLLKHSQSELYYHGLGTSEEKNISHCSFCQLRRANPALFERNSTFMYRTTEQVIDISRSFSACYPASNEQGTKDKIAIYS
jgi:hypothetical protein